MTRHADAQLRAIIESKYWRQEDAEIILGAMVHSGRSLSAFARHWGINRDRLRRWNSLLTKEPPRLPATPAFHPVHVVVEPFSPHKGDDGLELVLRGGRRVRLQRGFDEQLLERVVRLAESWPC